MNVRWTQAALSDLHAVEEYIARHSQRYAESLVQRIIDRTAALADHPLIGAQVPEYADDSIRELLETP